MGPHHAPEGRIMNPHTIEAIESLVEIALDSEAGDRPLHLLAAFDYRHPCMRSTVRALVELGEDPNGYNGEGLTPLHVLAQDALMSAPYEGDDEGEARQELVELLIALGADPEKPPLGGVLHVGLDEIGQTRH